MRTHVPVIARSTLVRRSPPSGEGGCDEAIQLPFLLLHGLLRGACHRAALRADPLARNDGWAVEAPSRQPIRSTHLTIFWHCGLAYFSSRTASERASGNEPSMVLAEDSASKGSGNADSQLFVRSSGWSGSRRAHPCDSGCVPAHPASWRAAASYRPLRAVWAVCAWALRGSREITRPPSALIEQRTS
jgi:hypothetical protein